jgi:hypothetical protein
MIYEQNRALTSTNKKEKKKRNATKYNATSLDPKMASRQFQKKKPSPMLEKTFEFSRTDQDDPNIPKS